MKVKIKKRKFKIVNIYPLEEMLQNEKAKNEKLEKH